MSFDKFKLDPWLEDGIAGAGYETPTPIQDEAIPAVLDGRDVLGLAQTGTGKTAAFALPIMERLLDGDLGHPRALIVAPTRELAEQINDHFKLLGSHTDLRTVTLYGGVGKQPQIDALWNGVEVVIACPGRMLDHHQHGDLDLSRIEILVLDEADLMMDMGFLPDIKRIVSLLPEKRQNLFFSATMPGWIRELADQVLIDPVTVQVDLRAPAETVTHALFPCTDRLRLDLLKSILREHNMDRALIFTRTKHRARSLATVLERDRHKVACLQGNMPQRKRQQALEGFRKGKFDILVATDIASRGIDISDVTHVINYDMPSTVDAYTHRIGRTGRALKTGDAFTLATQADETLVHRVENVLGYEIERRILEGFDYGAYKPEEQGYRRTEKKRGLSRSDGPGGMKAAGRMRRGGAPRGRRISRRG